MIADESTSTHYTLDGFSVTSVTHIHPFHIFFSSSIVLFSLVVCSNLRAAPGPVSSSNSVKFQYYLSINPYP